MSEKPVTLIVSDLHVGGGPADPGDDHIYQGGALVRLLDEQAASDDGKAGRLELVFNGDFLEFAQTNTAAFSHVSDHYWCTEPESLAKLDTILSGHPAIFEALRRFQANGSVVTIAAGNHDVDLAWESVRARLRAAAGADLRFEIGRPWIERQGGRLQIGHGHMHDAANRFEHWDHPIVTSDWGVPCLEMCPGTLFMVKFVNRLEAQYPFADNLLPVTKLLAVLMREDKAGMLSVAWLFSRLLGGSSPFTLEAAAPDEVGSRLLERARDDAAYRADVAAALAQARQDAVRERWLNDPPAADTLQAAMLALLGRADETTWNRLFDVPRSAVALGADDGVTLEALRKAAFWRGKEALRIAARDRAEETHAEVVVMGHTHQPDEAEAGAARYFNPGCWTRYLELGPGQRVTLDDLRDESRYPYALNYVRVGLGSGGSLDAAMVCFEQSTALPGRCDANSR
jgi:UDP-2,3-diacylglucosamine pyrophosphatase LpxH